jgi:hypothetical protein
MQLCIFFFRLATTLASLDNIGIFGFLLLLVGLLRFCFPLRLVTLISVFVYRAGIAGHGGVSPSGPVVFLFLGRGLFVIGPRGLLSPMKSEGSGSLTDLF